MDILKTGATLLIDKLNLDTDPDTVVQSLSGLLGNGDGGPNFGALAAKMASSADFSSLVGSWLGDGANEGISASGIVSLLGQGNVDSFASSLGIDSETAAGGMAEVLPEMMDKSSQGGALLDKLGGAEGLLGAARSFFK